MSRMQNVAAVLVLLSNLLYKVMGTGKFACASVFMFYMLYAYAVANGTGNHSRPTMTCKD